jgi:hypothetical protein
MANTTQAGKAADKPAESPAPPKYAFQCKNCGALEPAGAAGDNAVPSQCHVCRAGVEFKLHPGGTGFDRILKPENWIVLADLDEKQLKADFHRHGLTADRVARHKVAADTAAPTAGKTVVTTADESVGSKDKAVQK